MTSPDRGVEAGTAAVSYRVDAGPAEYLARSRIRVPAGSAHARGDRGHPDADFFFVEKKEPEEVLETLKLLIKNRIPEKFGFDPVNDVQVLTPMHRGLLGAANLNAEMRPPKSSQTSKYLSPAGASTSLCWFRPTVGAAATAPTGATAT